METGIMTCAKHEAQPIQVSADGKLYCPVCAVERAENKQENLLCTGGPAVRITGELSQHNEPETANLEYQDWFTSWTDYPLSGEDEEAVLTYARQFYFGE